MKPDKEPSTASRQISNPLLIARKDRTHQSQHTNGLGACRDSGELPRPVQAAAGKLSFR